MNNKTAIMVLALAGILGGGIFDMCSHQYAYASRNSSGVYSLPAGNPVVTGTTITSSWANTTLGNIGTEITNSLDRSGRGAMLAPLQCSSGTVALPGLTFSAETNSGLYRSASHDIRMGVNGALNQQWTTTTSLFSLGVTATNSQANSNAINAFGTGTGTAFNGLGGSSNGPGAVLTGGGTGAGAVMTGGSTGANGGVGVGTANGSGLVGTGGPTNGIGVLGAGTGTGYGGYFQNGTAATGGTRQDAIVALNGDINLDSVAHVTSTTSIKNRITPDNVTKHWVNMTTSAGATVTVNEGFNVTSATCAANNVTVTMPQGFASTAYAVSCSTPTSACSGYPVSSTTYGVSCISIGSGTQLNLCGGAAVVSCIAVGKQ